MSPESSDPEPESLCNFCLHQPECNEHHMMCVDFEPADSSEIDTDLGESED